LKKEAKHGLAQLEEELTRKNLDAT